MPGSSPGKALARVEGDKHYYVYILASKRNGTLYIGLTNDVIRRSWEHKEKCVPGFTRKYDIDRLVYFEQYDGILIAKQREANLKHWPRKWKLELIEKQNPDWNDLYEEICC